MSRSRRAARRGPAVRVVLVGLVVVATQVACSAPAGVLAGEGVAPAPELAAAAAPGAVLLHRPRPVAPVATGSGVELHSRITRIAGHLSDVRRERVTRRAGSVVAGYLDGALDGTPDRKGHALADFTAAAGRAARADGQVLRPRRPVEVTRARAWFAVAAPHGRPVGLTARLSVEGEEGTPVLTGRLLMTEVDGAWQVFGYDLARADAPTGHDADTDEGEER